MFSSIAHKTKFWSFTRKRFCLVRTLNCARISVVRALDCAQFPLHQVSFSQPSWNTAVSRCTTFIDRSCRTSHAAPLRSRRVPTPPDCPTSAPATSACRCRAACAAPVSGHRPRLRASRLRLRAGPAR